MLSALAGCSALAFPGVSLANNRFTIDPKAESEGPVVTDSAGNGYVAWLRTAEGGAQLPSVMFCKVLSGTNGCSDEQALALPAPADSATEGPVAAFPVLGSTANVVYVVAPRYVLDDVVIWTSEDGGEKFSGPKTVSAYVGAGVGDVLRNPLSSKEHPTSDEFDIASLDPYLGFTEVGDLDAKPFATKFEGIDASEDPTLAYTKAGLPVMSWWTFASPYEVDYIYLKKIGTNGEEKDWSASLKVSSDGYTPRLASGPAGLFLLSTEGSGEEQPTHLDVRKYNESANTFEAPVAVGTVPAGVAELFTPGNIFESASGTLYVTQMFPSGSGATVLRLWESTDDGASWHGEREVAVVGEDYDDLPPRLAATESGSGWVTFKDAEGLQIADLTSVPAAQPITNTGPPAITPTATALTTAQAGGGVSGASITVPQGTAVSDLAHISGTNAAKATGTVTYNVWKNSTCTVTGGAGSVASVSGGAVGASSAVKLAPGTYYWTASYSGDTYNSPSVSKCGSEILVVAVNETHLGLPSSNQCLSKRAFLVHPRAPKGVKLVSVEVLINGKLVKKGKLSDHATSVSLVGLPKGTFKVALITTSSKGKTYEEVRTFHTCVPGKHKGKK